MTRVVCRQDDRPRPWSTEVAWTRRIERERPYSDVVVVCYSDGSAACDRCQGRHPVEQLLRREGLRPAAGTPLGWGDTAQEQREDDEPPPSGISWPGSW